MLHRIKKKNDENEGKWVGIGGKFEEGETPEECCIREVREETGLNICDLRYRGTVDFISDIWGEEIMHIFTAGIPEGEGADLPECPEGVLEWIPLEKIKDLPAWEGDRIFLKLLADDAPFFSLRLRYEGEKLAGWEML